MRMSTMNYENLQWLVDTLDGDWPFKTVVADESTRLKSFRIGGKKLRKMEVLVLRQEVAAG